MFLLDIVQFRIHGPQNTQLDTSNTLDAWDSGEIGK
jgi:hypothetical protein